MGGEKLALEKNVSFAATKGSNNAVFTGKNNSCAILDKFERQENVGKERKQKVKVNKVVQAMQKAFRRHLNMAFDQPFAHPEACLDAEIKAKTVMNAQKRCSARDILIFSQSLVQFQDERDFAERAGLFLSALINESRQTNFAISTRNLTVAIDRLGHKNTKNIEVDGDAGDELGSFMKGGRITVSGNIGWISDVVIGGDIYQRKKQLVKDGKRTDEE